MSIKKAIVAASLLSISVLLTGCQTTQGLYSWGGYEDALYQYYKDPAEKEALAERLLTLIEEEAAKVPPGIYAEYGTLLMQQGKTDEAIVYFEKEKTVWPESRFLMDSMIDALSSKPDSQNQEES
ncbi:MAG: DUF4810 domain-containing protein [Endozoicomonas sp.]